MKMLVTPDAHRTGMMFQVWTKRVEDPEAYWYGSCAVEHPMDAEVLRVWAVFIGAPAFQFMIRTKEDAHGSLWQTVWHQ